MKPNKLITGLSILVLQLILSFQVWAITEAQPTELQKDNVILNQLKTGDNHLYSFTLPKDQFIRGEAMQIGVDLIVTIIDPTGKEIDSFDGPATGSEVFHFESDVAGKYLLKISPFKQSEGKYSLQITYSEPIATTPEGKIDQLMGIYGDGTPGGVVAIVRKGKIAYSKGYGMANVEYDIANTIATPYHMASVSKQFTAFAIAMLAEQGKLSIDDDVHQYLPQLPDFGQKITLRHLLNHTSGLRDHWNLWAMSGGQMDDVIRQQDLLALIYRQQELNFTPGDEFLYSNTGYLLLSEVVSKVSGEPFAKWMQSNVFKPLGMNSTQIYDNHERIVKGRAYSYQNTEEGLSKSVLSYANSGATSLFTTAEDLALWLHNFHTAKVGGPEVIKAMQVQGVLNNGETIKYALGLSIGKHNGLRKISHGGADAGFRTMLAYYPEIESGVIVLGNIASFQPGFISDTAAELFFAQHMTEHTKQDSEKSETASHANSTIPEEVAHAVIGKWSIENGPELVISFEQRVLFAQLENRPKRKLLPLGELLFRVDMNDMDIKIQFESAVEGKINHGTLHQNGGMPMKRLRGWQPDTKQLTQYTGRYFSEELETFYVIELEDENLMIKHIRHGDFKLTPKEKHSFNAGRWYLGEITFTQNESGEFSLMKMTNGRVRNLLFEKVE
ncbi:serine hydrolase domain-containing protein [Aliiglaciecola litoralis]|uniref:Beta-lactamase-related domain-containing protein n=1 Tax=Aliiglaciecola litoralis TaxID=582857 RepID=A0ABP3WNC4_9ALTE